MGPGHNIIVKYLQHVTYVILVQDCYKYRNSLTLLGVKIIATNANNNVDVICKPLVIEHDNVCFHAYYMY